MFKEDLKKISSFKELIELVSEEYSDKVAMQIRRRIRNEKVLYKDLPGLTNQVINFLEEKGINEGDRILIWGLNCPEYVILLLAIFMSKRTAIPIDFRTNTDTLGKILKQTKPKAAFISSLVDSKFIQKKVKQHYFLEELKDLIDDFSTKHSHEFDYEEDTPCELLFTSGTTGTPKGVVMHEKNIVEMAKIAQKLLPQLKDYRTISILPLSHVLEQVLGTAVALSIGTTSTYLTRINSAKIRTAMISFKPTYMVFVPQILSVFWQKIENTVNEAGKMGLVNKMMKVSARLPIPLRKILFKKVHKSFGGELDFVVSSGAPLNKKLALRFAHMGFKVLEVYGATEILASHVNNTEEGICTVGPAVDTVQMKVDDDKEIWIRSPYMTPGYFENPEKNKETFVDGWYKTGDIGEIDKEGRLIIVGRDTFKLVLRNGENIYVEDIEKKIEEHDAIKSVCVIGIDDNGADKVHALFILKYSKDEKNIKKIVKEINQTLESKQQILSYEIWKNEGFPRTHTLKINRREVKELISKNLKTGGHAEEEINTQPTSVMTVKQVISLVSKVEESSITDSKILTSDLGMNSLERAELTSVIEENLDVRIDGLKIDAKTTVGDVEKMVEEADPNTMPVKYPTWQYSKFWDIVRFFLFKTIVFPIHRRYAKISVVDDKRIKKKDLKNTIIVTNHPGFLDFVVVLRILRSQAVKSVGLAAGVFWTSKPLSKLLELGGAFPLDQSGNHLLSQMEIQADLVDKGRHLIIAPEGTMQRDGTQTKFQSGVGFLVSELGLNVIPIKIEGYAEIWPPPPMGVDKMSKSDWKKYLIPKKKGKVIVKIGKKLVFKKEKDPVKITSIIEDEFNKL